MFKHFIITAWRITRRSPVFSAINLLGLAIGLASFILIMRYVSGELSYDRFNKNYRNIYRINIDFFENGILKHQFATSNAGMAPVYWHLFPEVKNACRFYKYQGVVDVNDRCFDEQVCYGSAEIFEIFSLPVIEGQYTDLHQPGVVFLSQRYARKYFNEDFPYGKIINFNGEVDLKVAGVFADIPQQSHFRFDVLISWPTLETVAGRDFAEGWDFVDTYTYVLLSDGAYIPALEEKMTDYSHMKVREFIGDEEPRNIIRLQPLSEIHLHSHYLTEFSRNGYARDVYFLTVLAFFILGMAAVNFMNLSTARASRRSLEMSLRKINGANRHVLFWQLLGESFLLALAAMLLALAAVEFLFPSFGNMVGKDLTFRYEDPLLYASLLGLVVFTTLLAGIYPAWFLSRLSPAGIMKTMEMMPRLRGNTRRWLLGLQFTIAIGLIAGSLLVFRQVRFLRTAGTGYDMEQVMIVKAPTVFGEAARPGDNASDGRLAVFADELRRIPGVVSVCESSTIPGAENFTGNVAWSGDQKREVFCHIDAVEPEFFDQYNVDLLAGNFFGNTETDRTRAVVNAEFARRFGYPDPRKALNQKFLMFSQAFTICGVMNDPHHFGLQYPVEPLIYLLLPPDPQFHRYFSVKLSRPVSEEMAGVIGPLFLKRFPGNAYTWYDLKSSYEKQYATEIRFGTVILVFTLLSLLIVCLGLLGLSIFNAESRVKEIGIRKVFGAGRRNIIFLLASDSLMILVFSAVVSLPVSWLLARNWLDQFATAISPGWWFFVLPVVTILLITIAVISVQVSRSLRRNPADALRYE